MPVRIVRHKPDSHQYRLYCHRNLILILLYDMICFNLARYWNKHVQMFVIDFHPLYVMLEPLPHVTILIINVDYSLHYPTALTIISIYYMCQFGKRTKVLPRCKNVTSYLSIWTQHRHVTHVPKDNLIHVHVDSDMYIDPFLKGNMFESPLNFEHGSIPRQRQQLFLERAAKQTKN